MAREFIYYPPADPSKLAGGEYSEIVHNLSFKFSVYVSIYKAVQYIRENIDCVSTS